MLLCVLHGVPNPLHHYTLSLQDPIIFTMNMPTSTLPRNAHLRRRNIYNTIQSIPTLGAVQVPHCVITESRLFSHSRPVRAGPPELRMIAPEPDLSVFR